MGFQWRVAVAFAVLLLGLSGVAIAEDLTPARMLRITDTFNQTSPTITPTATPTPTSTPTPRPSCTPAFRGPFINDVQCSPTVSLRPGETFDFTWSASYDSCECCVLSLDWELEYDESVLSVTDTGTVTALAPGFSSICFREITIGYPSVFVTDVTVRDEVSVNAEDVLERLLGDDAAEPQDQNGDGVIDVADLVEALP